MRSDSPPRGPVLTGRRFDFGLIYRLFLFERVFTDDILFVFIVLQTVYLVIPSCFVFSCVVVFVRACVYLQSVNSTVLYFLILPLGASVVASAYIFPSISHTNPKFPFLPSRFGALISLVRSSRLPILSCLIINLRDYHLSASFRILLSIGIFSGGYLI